MTSPQKKKPLAYKHQALALREMHMNRHGTAWKEGFGLFLEMGLGKTKVALDAWSDMLTQDAPQALVLAPRGMFHQWQEEFLKHAQETVLDRVEVVYWTHKTTVKAKKDLSRLRMGEGSPQKLFIMNTEALVSKRAQAACEKFLKQQRTLMVVDEASMIKNNRAKRSKTIHRLGMLAAYRFALTGSPVTQSPLDLWSIFKFINPDVLGNRFVAFRSRYAKVVERQVRTNGVLRSYPDVVGYQNLDELKRLIAPHCIILKKADCLDLPPKVYVKREVLMSDGQRHLYERMCEQCLIELEDCQQVTAPLVLTKLLRLRQILCGFVVPENEEGKSCGKALDIDVNSPRDREALAVIEEAGGNVVIWTTFRHTAARLASLIAKEHGPESVCQFVGGIANDERKRIVNDFSDVDNPLRFFVSTIQAGYFGLNLQAANVELFYDNTFSFDQRGQAEDRCHRIGQKKSVTIIDLVSPGTVDERVLECLKSKAELAEIVAGGQFKELFK